MFADYEELTQAVTKWLLENGVSVQPKILIGLAEDALATDPRLYDKKAVSLALDTSGVVTLPSDCQEILAWTLGSPYSMPLRVAAEIDSASTAAPGVPQTYHIVDGKAYLRPVPFDGMSSDLTYRAEFQRLSSTNKTNDYLTNWPSLYWYAAIAQGADHSNNPQLAEVMRANSERLVKRIKNFQERRVMGGAVTRRVQLGGSATGF